MLACIYPIFVYNKKTFTKNLIVFIAISSYVVVATLDQNNINNKSLFDPITFIALLEQSETYIFIILYVIFNVNCIMKPELFFVVEQALVRYIVFYSVEEKYIFKVF